MTDYANQKKFAMQLPEYITVQEVQRVCKELGLSDWSKIIEPKVLPEEARIILGAVNTAGVNIPLEDFCAGLEVELEHGTQFKDANVIHNHPILTGKIVLAHLKESMDYYKRLEVAEVSLPPPRILRISAINCPRCRHGPPDHLRRKLWMRLLPASRYYKCHWCSMKFLEVYKWTIRWG